MSQPDPHAARLRRRLGLLVLVLITLLGLALAWSSTPLRAWLDMERVVAALRDLGRSFGPTLAIAGFALASTLAVPLTFLVLVTIVAFGPFVGALCALVGALLGAAASHGVGAALGKEAVQRLAGPKVNLISQRLAQRGLLAVIAVRLVPIAPFAIINMVAGAAHISLRHMLVGTAIGMLPSTLAMALFVDQILAAMRQPGPSTVALLALTVVLIVAGVWAMRRWLLRGSRG